MPFEVRISSISNVGWISTSLVSWIYLDLMDGFEFDLMEGATIRYDVSVIRCVCDDVTRP